MDNTTVSFNDKTTANRHIRLNELNLALAMLITAWVSSIQIKYCGFINGSAILIVFAAWFCIALYLHKDYVKALVRNDILFLAVFILFVLISSILSIRGLNNSFYNYSILLIVFCIYVYYNEYGSKIEKRILLLTVLSTFMATAVVTVYNLIINPRISRYVSSSWFESSLAMVVGGFFFIYALVPVIIGGLTVLKNRLDSKTGYFLLVILFFVLTVILSNFVTAIIFMVLLVPFIYFRPSPKMILIFAAIIVCLLTGLITVNILFPNAFAKALGGVLSPVMAERVNNLVQIFSGNLPASSSLYERLEKLNLTTSTIISSPLLGVFGKPANVISASVGGHMQWLDDLATYGLIGVIPFWLFMVRFADKLVHKCKFKAYKRALYLIIIYFTVWGFTNPVLKGEVLSVLFIAIPFMPYIFDWKDKTDENIMGV